MPVYLGNVLLHAGNQLVGPVRIELEDARHLYLHQLEDVVLGHFADKGGVVRRQALVDVLAGSVHALGLFKLLVLIDAFLDEYLLQRGEVQAFHDFAPANLQLAAQQGLGVVHRLAQHVAHRQEVGLLVVYHAAVGRYAHLAVGKGIEGVDGLVRRHARCQVHQYFHVVRGEVFHLAYLDFSFLAGFHDGVAHAGHRLAVGNFADGERLVVHLLYLGAYAHAAAPFAVVVLRHIYRAPRLEVRIELERLFVQVADGSLAQLVEVMGQYLGRQAHGNALHALCQEQGELYRQGHRLTVAPVVG